MDFLAGAEVLFGVGEEVVRTLADEVGAAVGGVGVVGCGGLGGGGAHELFEEAALFWRRGVSILCPEAGGGDGRGGVLPAAMVTVGGWRR